jgi:hypothetical protein
MQGSVQGQATFARAVNVHERHEVAEQPCCTDKYLATANTGYDHSIRLRVPVASWGSLAPNPLVLAG